MVVAAPDVWFGADAFAWGHLLNAVSAIVLLVAVATLGWRIRPAVGALAAVGYLAVPYLHDLTRTARLDVPAAALVLVYLVVGIDAVRRGSLGRGALTGLIFAIAFLVKEIALPFAPVPFLVGILVGRPLSSIARVGAAALLVGLIGTSWWFVLFAQLTGQVYRLGTPVWTAAPLLVLAVVAIGGGLAAPRLARTPRFASALDAPVGRLPGRLRAHPRAVAGWGLAIAWFVGLTVFFDINGELKGNGLFQPGQYVLYLKTWLPQLLLVVVFGAVGVALSFLARRTATSAEREGIDTLLLATLCGVPLILLVIAVGEPPRNYLAQIGILTALSAAGWLWALERALASRRSILTVAAFVGVGAAAGAIVAQAVHVLPIRIGLAVGAVGGLAIAFRPQRDAGVPSPDQGPTARLGGAGLGAVLVAILVVASTVLAGHALRYRESATGVARAAAVEAASSWIAANRPAGTKIGFGSFLGYETALDVAAGYPMDQIAQQLAVVDPSAPLALAAGSGPPISDWIAVESSRREREFYVFRGSSFASAIRKSGISVYVYDTGPTTSVPSLLGALTPDHGFTLLTSGSFPAVDSTGATTTTETHIFAIDQARVGFADSPTFIPAAALTRLVGLLESDPKTAPATAANLAARLVVWPDAAAGTALIDRLRVIAGR
jgi:hypothetical protein